MTDYSQGGEQEYILKALGYEVGVDGTPLGVFRGERLLDIGAWNAKTFSNSRALIEMGWSAVLFEPSPGPLHGLVKEYGNNPRVEVVGLPVSVKGGLMKIRCTDDALSSDEQNIEHFKTWEGYGFYGSLHTWAVAVWHVFDHWSRGDGSNNFDFVSIDTEGSSVDILAEMLRLGDEWPRCIVVEYDNRFDEVKDLVKGRYRPLFYNGINIVLERIP